MTPTSVSPRPPATGVVPMNWVMPMAGAGARFARAGFALPKPLVDVAGVPMYRRATDSLPLGPGGRLVFVLRRDAWLDRLLADIADTYGHWHPRLVVLDAMTGGQAETVLRAATELDPGLPTLVHNADSAFGLAHPPATWAHHDGVLAVFRSTDPRYSFARTADGRLDAPVVEVREKQAISHWASTGTYYWRDTPDLLARLERMVAADQREGGEYYLAPLYNPMIAEGHAVRLVEAARFDCFGTPEERAAFLDGLASPGRDASDPELVVARSALA